MNIPRLALIQSLINKNQYSNYLEIGVSIGTVFFRVHCRNKIAVDPAFGFNRFKILTRSMRLGNFSNLSAGYFEKTSDDFFKDNAGKAIKGKLDISLVDGMHEYAYALNDIQNTLNYLSDDGVIIIHDCNPAKAENACTYEEWKKRGYTGEWNGDVWKSIVFLRSMRPELNVFVADTDYGLGIVTKKPVTPNQVRDRLGSGPLPFKSFEEIKAIDFSDFDKKRKEWLNLKPASYLNDCFGLNLQFS
ncbi:MAG TPA: class I SAM-dependent methyltransferase [Chitinophagaceae bacterium]